MRAPPQPRVGLGMRQPHQDKQQGETLKGVDMNVKEREEHDEANTAVLADLPAAESQSESVTGGLRDNSHGTHVSGTIGSVSNNAIGI